ncbi:MAG: DUF2490 domain-containing protein [Aridibacter sp.]
MKKQIIFLIGFLILFAGFAQAQTGDDTQFWNETTVEFPINKKVSGIVIGNLRVTDDISDLSDKRIGFAVKFKTKKNVSIQPSYIFRVQTAGGRANRYEHRARLDITPAWEFKNFAIENRSRFEHRFKTNGRDDDTFYRNRTKLKVPVKRNDKTIITPFISNDTYFDLQAPNVYRNDSVVGISRKFSKNATAEFFYQYRKNFRSGEDHINIVGVNLKFKID